MLLPSLGLLSQSLLMAGLNIITLSLSLYPALSFYQLYRYLPTLEHQQGNTTMLWGSKPTWILFSVTQNKGPYCLENGLINSRRAPTGGCHCPRAFSGGFQPKDSLCPRSNLSIVYSGNCDFFLGVMCHTGASLGPKSLDSVWKNNNFEHQVWSYKELSAQVWTDIFDVDRCPA